MKVLIRFILLAFIISVTGCISWDEGWKTKVQTTGTGDVKALLASAASLEATADTAAKVKDVIAAYEKVIAIDPGNYDALAKAGEFAMLNGYIYAKNKKEKEEYYLKAINYCERAMYTNPEFKKLADKGKSAWECTDALTQKEMSAMFYWYVSAGQYWTECFGSFSHLLNFSLPGKVNAILQKMSDINPDTMNGRVHMAWGSFYAIVPGFLGGDMKKSEEEFSKAVKAGPDIFVNYYTRARYLHVNKGDKDAFKKDLEFIISNDISRNKIDYAWNFGYKMKAKELLAKEGELF
ncbi:MAG TPA: TRAP transporter TatT component family protein [Spirochaetota bacterium]|nr:TRAP transporter TatT component family protein [Spirochaetota bacterium]